MEDNNGYYKDAFSFIDYCDNDNMIWDLAYNARVEAMRALLTSDNVDLTKKNEVGHDALYVALGNVFLIFLNNVNMPLKHMQLQVLQVF